jgi:hypothetical protein
MNEAWIGFIGTIIGGLLTLAGVILTICYYKKQERENNASTIKSEATSLYWFFEFKIETVKSWYLQVQNATQRGDVLVPADKVIYGNDYQFLFERIKSMPQYLSEEEIWKLLNFYKYLCTLNEICSEAGSFQNDMKRFKEEYSNAFKPALERTKNKIDTEIEAILKKIKQTSTTD